MVHEILSYSEGFTPIPTARFPALGKEFCFVHQVPPYAGICDKVWGQMPENPGWGEIMDKGPAGPIAGCAASYLGA